MRRLNLGVVRDRSDGGTILEGQRVHLVKAGSARERGACPLQDGVKRRRGQAPPRRSLAGAWFQFPTAAQAWPSPLAGARQQPPHLPSAGPRPNQRRSLGGGCHVPHSALPISVAAANGLQGRGSGDRAPAGSPLARASRPPARFM